MNKLSTNQTNHNSNQTNHNSNQTNHNSNQTNHNSNKDNEYITVTLFLIMILKSLLLEMMLMYTIVY